MSAKLYFPKSAGGGIAYFYPNKFDNYYKIRIRQEFRILAQISKRNIPYKSFRSVFPRISVAHFFADHSAIDSIDSMQLGRELDLFRPGAVILEEPIGFHIQASVSFCASLIIADGSSRRVTSACE